jgi:hypothetical protein
MSEREGNKYWFKGDRSEHRCVVQQASAACSLGRGEKIEEVTLPGGRRFREA